MDLRKTNSHPRSRSRPFLKWPGGKRWLTRYILDLLEGSSYGTYFEPFLGGGALFFALQPEKSVLSDINGDLINTYVQVRHKPHELIRRLKELPVDKQAYDDLRSLVPERHI